MGQIKAQVAQLAGIQDSNGTYNFDSTTFPTSGLAQDMFNDTIREVASSWDYTFLETTRSYPFYHEITDVQSLFLSGTNLSGTAITGIITPYPSDVLNYTWTANNQPRLINSNYSGINFTGVTSGYVSFTGVSTSGSITTGTYSGVGFVYQMNSDIDKFLPPGILIQNTSVSGTAAGVICQNTYMEDIFRLIPIGLINASGTPSYFTEAPGMSPDNNKAIQFFPFPTTSYSGQTFTVPYKKRHVDLTDDTETQNVIPESYQQVIVQGFLEKVFELVDPNKSVMIKARKEDLIKKMKVWDANQPSKMPRWRDYNYNSSVSSAYDNSTWLSLGDAPR